MAFVKMSKGLRSAALPAGRPSSCVPVGRRDEGPRFHRGWVGCDAHVCVHEVCDRRTEASCSWFEILMFSEASGALTASLFILHDQFTSLYYSTAPQYPQEIKSSNAVKQIHIQPRLLCSCFSFHGW